VGEQIAQALHCVLTMLVVEDIEIPGESMNIGGVSQNGSFAYNTGFSAGEIDEYVSEFHGYLEEQKREAFQRINRLIGDGGLIDMDLLRNHVVILVADGLDDGATLDVAMDFLKAVRIQRLIIATPVASVAAVDKMHMLADELHVLDVKENSMGVDHYFVVNVTPSHEETIAKINQIVLNWR
jgi:predicted phosphoribosyltransferase